MPALVVNPSKTRQKTPQAEACGVTEMERASRVLLYPRPQALGCLSASLSQKVLISLMLREANHCLPCMPLASVTRAANMPLYQVIRCLHVDDCSRG